MRFKAEIEFLLGVGFAVIYTHGVLGILVPFVAITFYKEEGWE